MKKSDISTLSNGKRSANGANVETNRRDELKDLRILSIVLSTKDDVSLLIEEAKYKIVFGRQQRIFWIKISITCSRMKILR